MPEYAQVETTMQCSQQTLQLVLEQFTQMLHSLRYESTELISWLRQITWPPFDEEGSVDFLISPTSIYLGESDILRCAGLQILIRKNSKPGFSEDGWLTLSIFFDAESLREKGTGFYLSKVGRRLWMLLQQVAGVFKNGGVYFTDEFQEGQTVRALISPAQDKDLWAFDLALVPDHLINYFGEVPELFQRVTTNNWIGFARRDRWVILPWTEII